MARPAPPHTFLAVLDVHPISRGRALRVLLDLSGRPFSVKVPCRLVAPLMAALIAGLHRARSERRGKAPASTEAAMIEDLRFGTGPDEGGAQRVMLRLMLDENASLDVGVPVEKMRFAVHQFLG
jgi:hypothetical protein